MSCEELSSSPFIAVERWMEVMGNPPWPTWMRMKGVPLQAWCEETFHLLGDCVDSTLEVDNRNFIMQILDYGRVKVLKRKGINIFLRRLPLC